MSELKLSVKTGLTVTERDELYHKIILKNIQLCKLEKDLHSYKVKVERNSEKGCLSFELIIRKEALDKASTLKLGIVTITKNKEFINISLDRLISHKSIQLHETRYKLEYAHTSPVILNVSYSIPKSIFEQKYKPAIDKMLQRREQKPLITVKPSKKTKHTRASIQQNTKDKNVELKAKRATITNRNRDNRNVVRTARADSFRRCGNCDYYSTRPSQQCGLFSRTVGKFNLCSRFHYTKLRLQFSGSFSPR